VQPEHVCFGVTVRLFVTQRIVLAVG
jgi:hypothetical protein